jgi:hypothetical protein
MFGYSISPDKRHEALGPGHVADILVTQLGEQELLLDPSAVRESGGHHEEEQQY